MHVHINYINTVMVLEITMKKTTLLLAVSIEKLKRKKYMFLEVIMNFKGQLKLKTTD